MKARLLKSTKIVDLQNNVGENLELYRREGFDFLISDPGYYIETSHEIDSDKLAHIDCTKKDLKEVKNCKLIFEAMNNISLYLARDPRLWVYTVHTDLLSYSRKRWPIPEDDEKAIKYIRTHYFLSGTRGFERNNSASRLWWMAHLCSRCSELSLDDALSCFLFDFDTRAGIIERPTTSQSVNVFNAIIKHLHKSYQGDKSLLNRKKFRPAMRKLNLIGGIKLLAALDHKDVYKIFEKCL